MSCCAYGNQSECFENITSVLLLMAKPGLGYAVVSLRDKLVEVRAKV